LAPPWVGEPLGLRHCVPRRVVTCFRGCAFGNGGIARHPAGLVVRDGFRMLSAIIHICGVLPSPRQPRAPPIRPPAPAHLVGMSLWAQAAKQALKKSPGKKARDPVVVRLAKRIYGKLRRSAGGAGQGAATKTKAMKKTTAMKKGAPKKAAMKKTVMKKTAMKKVAMKSK